MHLQKKKHLILGFFPPFLAENKAVLAIFSVAAKKRWDREAQAAFKGVQLIKNRTDRQTTNTHTSMPFHMDIMHKHTRPQRAATTYCSQVELEWTGSDYTQQKEPPLQTLSCSLFSVFSCICVCVHKYSPHTVRHI